MMVPYLTSVCAAKSSGELIFVTMRSTVRNAAKFAVYEDISMRVKNHQTEPTIRPETDRGEMSQPCCMNAPSANHKEFIMLNSFTDGCIATVEPPDPADSGVAVVPVVFADDRPTLPPHVGKFSSVSPEVTAYNGKMVVNAGNENQI